VAVPFAFACTDQPTGPLPDDMLAVVDITGRAPTGPCLAVIRLDGSGYHCLLPDPGAGDPVWVPDGSRLLFHRLLSPGDEFPHVYLANLAGDTTRLIAPGGSLIAEWYPVVAPDGHWIYFAGRTASEGYGVWESRLDGTAAARIGRAPMPYGTGVDRVMSVSPDGRYLIFENSRSGEQRLATLDLTSGQVADLQFRGENAQWSPLGTRIAYVDWDIGRVHTVRPDGTDDRIVSNPVDVTFYGGRCAWSPDGRFLIARALGGLHLIDVTTTRTTPLTFGGPLESPSWRPR